MIRPGATVLTRSPPTRRESIARRSWRRAHLVWRRRFAQGPHAPSAAGSVTLGVSGNNPGWSGSRRGRADTRLVPPWRHGCVLVRDVAADAKMRRTRNRKANHARITVHSGLHRLRPPLYPQGGATADRGAGHPLLSPLRLSAPGQSGGRPTAGALAGIRHAAGDGGVRPSENDGRDNPLPGTKPTMVKRNPALAFPVRGGPGGRHAAWSGPVDAAIARAPFGTWEDARMRHSPAWGPPNAASAADAPAALPPSAHDPRPDG
jgi:hypothetical protein